MIDRKLFAARKYIILFASVLYAKFETTNKRSNDDGSLFLRRNNRTRPIGPRRVHFDYGDVRNYKYVYRKLF